MKNLLRVRLKFENDAEKHPIPDIGLISFFWELLVQLEKYKDNRDVLFYFQLFFHR